MGFLLRRAYQRHLGLFSSMMVEDLTAMQFATLAKLEEVGETSQNRLGRLTAMDVATVKGVVGRLQGRGMVEKRRVPEDRRMTVIGLTDTGRTVLQRAKTCAATACEETLAPLSPEERHDLMSLLQKIT
ncbi:MarR family transcriptional regulator [Roseospira goensis]|uniref:DNA-binding MarR family transcriptional regulator n=1 Tax=Roseospira goensis TaxID=391922 RepID=A0A7W6RZR6_9PROT|nr:DNA-binding MarR family transcriptional regulator [Roseospira goensis]